MENKIVNLQVNDNINETNKSLGTLKSQLRDAQNEVNSLSEKFGATSREAVEAAKQAAVLKDKIGDAKALTDAFNPDAKFKAVSASLSGVASGFAAYQGAMGLAGVESKDLEQQLLKVQSAMAIAQGLQGLGEARDSFKQLKAVGVNAFNAIKGAIGATGIGLIVLAAGAIYAYWDDIKGAVSGVSEEQKRLNGLSQINADQAANKLKDLGNQDNVLKLQGKSEKEILNIKIKATDEAIAAARIRMESDKTTLAMSIEGAKRNYQYLKSAIDFVTIPQRYLYENAAKAINSIIALINKIPGVKFEGRLDEKFGDKAAEFITKLAFDPDKTEADGAATAAAAKEAIDKMVNDRAGMKNSINAIDKTAATDAQKTQDDAEKIKLDAAIKSEKDAMAILDELKKSQETPAQKENREYLEKKTILEANHKDLTLLNKTHEENLALISKTEKEKAATEAKIISDKILADKKEADDKELEFQKNKDSAIAASKQNLNNIVSELEASGINKSKEGQIISKAIALTQIGIDSAVAISKASTLANAEGVAAQLAFPLVPGIGTIARVVSYASTAASVIGNITRARQLLSSGGSGGGGGSAPSGGGVPAAPQFNVVGQGGANQLAQGMANQEQAPVQAYVVAGAVTSGQALNRNIINNASMG